MNILYLAHRIPYPPNKGDKIRSYHQVAYLAGRHQLDLVCLADDPRDLVHQADLSAICSRVEVFPLRPSVAKVKGLISLLAGGSISAGYFYQPTMQRSVDHLLEEREYDAVVCFSSTMAAYLFRSRVFAELARPPRLIMDFCDVDSDKWLQYAAAARFPLKQLYRLENRRLAAYECRIQSAFDRTLLISRAEADLFSRFCIDGLEKLVVIANGVDHQYFSPEHVPPAPNLEPCTSDLDTPACNLVFTGAMDYHANVDGVLWFCREIWPRLRQRHPELQFYLVGSNPTADVKELAKLDGVSVTGFVDDIRAYYALADICVVPLRLARGVQNKVLEAMAMGKPVVTTSKANAGIQAVDGDHLLVADSASEFAEQVETLIESPDKAQRLATAARDFVVSQYDWETNLKKLTALLG